MDALVDEQLYEARRKLLEYEAAAEHHAAMTEMYRRRVERLSGGGSVTSDDSAPYELHTGKRIRTRPYVRIFRSVGSTVHAPAKS